MIKLLLIVSLTFCLGSTYRQQVDKIERQMDELIEQLKGAKGDRRSSLVLGVALASILLGMNVWIIACGDKSFTECRRERKFNKKIAECRKEGNKGIMECINEVEAEYGQSN